MKVFLFALLLVSAGSAAAQTAPTAAATPDSAARAQGEAIVNRYLTMVDYSPMIDDSVLFVTSFVVDRAYPSDTMILYRWWQRHNRSRVEVWQNGMMDDAMYTDGNRLHRRFVSGNRSWADITQGSYSDRIVSLDIRGALYGWEAKGAEIAYAGEYELEGTKVDQVFVTCPGMFDRHYFFEKESGLLFLVTEDNHIYGDQKIDERMTRCDWRGWHEFVPFRGCLLPSSESYQANQNQTVIITHTYSCIAPDDRLFTEDFRKR